MATEEALLPARAPAPAQELEPAPAPAQKLEPAPAQKLEPAPAQVQKLEPAQDPAQELEPAPAQVQKLEPAQDPAQELEPAPAQAQKLEPAPAQAQKLEPAQDPAQELEPAPAPALARELKPAPIPARAWPHGGDVNVDILTLLRIRDQLKEQVMEYNTATLAEKENFLDYPNEENFIQSATEELQKAIEEVKVSFRNKTLALRRIQIMDALRKKLKQDDEDSRLILETIKHILLLSRTIIEYQQQARQKEEELIDIKRKRLLLKNREQKLQEMRTVRKKEEEKEESVNGVEIQKMLEILQRARETTTILQNVLQSIIFGSTVNWAEDPSLKEIVLQLEKNVYLQ